MAYTHLYNKLCVNDECVCGLSHTFYENAKVRLRPTRGGVSCWSRTQTGQLFILFIFIFVVAVIAFRIEITMLLHLRPSNSTDIVYT